ncbi:MAG: hypothetical protein QNI95_14105, partial [Desulfobacterales bacterium]|nr:hypothetical protein [Desulfobacterales bacterium]
MKRIFGLTLAVLLLLGSFSFPSMADDDVIKVMTRNQYLGADLTPVLEATEATFVQAATDAIDQIAANDFPRRARRLATEVALTKPDVIGLQEVYNFTLNGINIGPPTAFVDHLTETLDALKEKNQNYIVAATVENLNITIPIEGIGFVGVLDRDIILVREGTTFEKLIGNVDEGGLCGVPIGPIPGLIPDELRSTPSIDTISGGGADGDGCNYTVFLTSSDPIHIEVKRGFVGIDLTVR